MWWKAPQHQSEKHTTEFHHDLTANKLSAARVQDTLAKLESPSTTTTPFKKFPEATKVLFPKGRGVEEKKLAVLTMATIRQNRREFQLEDLPFDVRQRVEKSKMEVHQRARRKRISRVVFYGTQKFRLVLNL
uniref:Uncharacterized protein n=1 Tax=Glossina pallidipes TaxID=7398 RepID=A0A1A9ZZC4_GLOPL